MAPILRKKAELQELLNILNLPNPNKATKIQLEETLITHLSAHPTDAALDPRLDDYVSTGNGDESSTSETESQTPEEKLVEKVGEIKGNVEVAVAKQANATRSHLEPVVSHVHNHLLQLRGNLSTVSFVNYLILFIELSLIILLNWPKNYLGGYLYEFEDLKTPAKKLGFYFATLVLPALFFAFVINFTQKSAIRRKKHVYKVDPVLFGVARILSSVYVHAAGVDLLYYQVAGFSGLVSALVGIYASLLQIS